MTTHGTHFSSLVGKRQYGRVRPSNPVDGEEWVDNINNLHCVYSGDEGEWFCAALTTSTSTSTSTTSTSTSTTSTSTTTTSTSTSTTSTSTTTTV